MLMSFFWGNSDKRYSYEKIQQKVEANIIDNAIKEHLVEVVMENGFAWCYITAKGEAYLK